MNENIQQDTTEQTNNDRITFVADTAVTSLAEYGMEWTAGEIHSGKGSNKKLLRKDAPVVKCIDLDKMRRTFGDAFVKDALNGSSIIVQVQGIVRRKLERNTTTSNDDLKRAVIQSVFQKIRTREAPAPKIVTVVKVQGADGKMYDSQEEADAAFTASQAEKLAKMIDAGMDAATARSILGL